MSRPIEATPDQVLVAIGGIGSAVVFLAVVGVVWRLAGNRNERRAHRIYRESQRLASMDRGPAGLWVGR